MALADIVQKVKGQIYGNFTGEHPAIALLGPDVGPIVSSYNVVFSALTDEGDKIAVGDVLSVLGSASADDANVLRVTGVAGDVVTAINGWFGSPSITDDGDELDGDILEINPVITEHVIWQKVNTVLDTFLYPYVYQLKTYSVTPDLTDYEVELNANVETIKHAWQVWGGENIPIEWELYKDVHSSVSSTGVMARLYALDGSNVYVTTREKWTSSDTLDAEVEDLIAVGAAALCLGATVSATHMEPGSKVSRERAEAANRPGDSMWRDFVAMREALAETLAQDDAWFEIYR